MDDVKERRQLFEISVILVDHTEVIFWVSKHDRGQVLLDAVFEHVQCKEPKYYGLQFQDTMKWLDASKSIRKQFKRGYPLLVYYRIKYYIYDMRHINHTSTRYQLFLQVKKDVMEQKLGCSFLVAATLTSYAVQSELGDFHPEQHETHYLQNFSFLPYKTKEFLCKVKELHKLHRGLEPTQAELLFLEEAKKLSTYGVDVHYGQTPLGDNIELGVSTEGIGVFKHDGTCGKYDWSKIIKISFKRKQFFLQIQRGDAKGETSTIEFTMENYRACKCLWRNCVDCHSFYRHDKEKFADRSTTRKNGTAKADRVIFGLFTIGGRNNKAKYDKADKEMLGFRNPQKSASSKILNSSTGNCLFPREASRQDLKESRRLSAPPSVTLSAVQDGADHSISRCKHNMSFVDLVVNDDEAGGELLEKYYDSPFTHQHDFVVNNDRSPQYVLPEDMVLVRLKPDKEGRFGFNIKGGVDLKMPITISKIADMSPAANCQPKLKVGDAIEQINGRDANAFTHDQAVNFIRSTREKYFGELILLMRQETNCETSLCNSEIDTFLRNKPLLPQQEFSSLESSMARLKSLLDQHEDVMLFNALLRKRPDLCTKCARLPCNVHRNRYRDISPYDETRVILNDWETDYINANHILMKNKGTTISNHYIASQGPLKETCGDFWAMVQEQGSTLIVMVTTTMERGLVKCHQYWPDVDSTFQFGPLKVYCQSEVTENCMVIREFHLSKPAAGEGGGCTRKISHFQYIGWPDHGVPDSSADFLTFVQRIRQERVGNVAPTVIHCSAGIGRTGVFIAIDTAMCLIKADQPVCPLQITRRLRDQRAMMIQTAVQFRFVCEAVYHVYEDTLRLSADVVMPAAI